MTESALTLTEPLPPPDAPSGGKVEARLRPYISRKDRRTLEIRHFFPLPFQEGQEVAYSYDAYLFFPSSMGVNAHSWPREDFYKAATIAMRLHSPGLSLKDLHNLDNPRNPAAILRKHLPELLTPEVPTGASLAILAQMFGSEVADKVTEGSKALRSALGNLSNEAARDRFEDELSAFCDEALLALGTLRRVRAKALAYAPIVPPSLLPALSLAEEFASAVVDEQLSKLAIRVESAPHMRDGSGRATRLRLRLSNAVEQVNQRRMDQGFPVPHTSGARQEIFTYRLELLKAEMQRSLNVDTRAVKRDPFFRNSAAMVSAGLAATWATLAQIQMWESGLQSPNSLLFLSAAVGAYILKDRIKEWGRNWLADYFLRWDHNQNLVNATLNQFGLGAFTGRVRERMHFASPAALPPEILQLRAACWNLKGLAESDDVIHYRRELYFQPRAGTPVPEGYAIKEALRLNLRELLSRLEDPQDTVSFYERSSGRFQQTVLPRIYNLNVVLVTRDLIAGRECMKGCRVVVDRKRIRRVESVVIR